MRRYILMVESGMTLPTADQTTDQTTGEVALGLRLALPAGPSRLTMLKRKPRKTWDIILNMSEVSREGATRAQGAQDLHQVLRWHPVARRLHVRRFRKAQAGP